MYSIRIPFTLSPNQSLNLEDGETFDLLGHKSEICREDYQYVLTINDFGSESDASIFLLKICAGFYWYGLTSSFGFKFDVKAEPVRIHEKSKHIAAGSNLLKATSTRGWKEIDGRYDANKTVIIPQHKKLIMFGGGPVSLRIGRSVSSFSNGLAEGITHGNAELVMDDPKLLLACEVYQSSHFESTPAASFLSRITTLEILTGDAAACEPVVTLVESFLEQANAALDKTEEPEMRKGFESLLGNLSRNKKKSITSQIRNLVEQALNADPDIDEPREVGKEIAKLYGLRSKLVHNASPDAEEINSANNRLDEIVPKVLKSLYRKTAQQT